MIVSTTYEEKINTLEKQKKCYHRKPLKVKIMSWCKQNHVILNKFKLFLTKNLLIISEIKRAFLETQALLEIESVRTRYVTTVDNQSKLQKAFDFKLANVVYSLQLATTKTKYIKNRLDPNKWIKVSKPHQLFSKLNDVILSVLCGRMWSLNYKICIDIRSVFRS